MTELKIAKAKLGLPALMMALGDQYYLKKSGRCPFHDDKHNSFSVFPSRSGGWLWKCHAGCGGGDQVEYLKQRFNLSTGEAIRRLCEMAGVDPKRR